MLTFYMLGSVILYKLEKLLKFSPRKFPTDDDIALYTVLYMYVQ